MHHVACQKEEDSDTTTTMQLLIDTKGHINATDKVKGYYNTYNKQYLQLQGGGSIPSKRFQMGMGWGRGVNSDSVIHHVVCEGREANNVMPHQKEKSWK